MSIKIGDREVIKDLEKGLCWKREVLNKEVLFNSTTPTIKQIELTQLTYVEEQMLDMILNLERKVGKLEEKQRWRNREESEGLIIDISGPRGSGKTTLSFILTSVLSKLGAQIESIPEESHATTKRHQQLLAKAFTLYCQHAEKEGHALKGRKIKIKVKDSE